VSPAFDAPLRKKRSACRVLFGQGEAPHTATGRGADRSHVHQARPEPLTIDL
jgi:hypothetical protein